jgi:enoyl-CoA hydratase/carnithine racemase
VTAIKRAVVASRTRDGFLTEAAEFGKAMTTADKVEGIAAFLEKRAAAWKGE